MKTRPNVRPLLLALLYSAVWPAGSFSQESAPAPAPAVVRSITQDEIRADFEDFTGRAPNSAETRKYVMLAQQHGWDRQTFREEFRRSDECRAVTPARAIDSAFRDLLHRKPTWNEREELGRHFERDDWTPGRLRQHLRESDEFRMREVDAAIEHAYRELLDRRPDIEGRSHYRELMLRRGMTEEELYRKIKDSQEFRVTVPNARITRAYMAVLKRKPDQRGLESYRAKVVNGGWTQEQIEKDLRRSAEYAALVDDIIRRLYIEVLKREPDPKGLKSYREAMLERGWSEEKLRNDLRRSEEYRQAHRR